MVSVPANAVRDDDEVQPESGIHFVLYNGEFEVVEENTGLLAVEDKINTIQTLATDKMIMTEAGFLEIFVNNDAQTPVYFDNLRVAQTSGFVSEVNAYYPFGMLIGTLSFQAAGDEYNAYKYSQKELQTEMNLNWGDHGARMADYTIGRWWVPDPLAEARPWESSYSYCGNNPINRIDPTGLIWNDSIQAEQLKDDINNKITNLREGNETRQNELNEEGKTTEERNRLIKRINAVNNRISKLNESLSDIDRLGNDQNNVYAINNQGQLNGNVTKDGGIVSINAGTTGLIVHEIKHIAQSLDAGGLNFETGSNKLQYYAPSVQAEVNAEMGAYQAQFSYNGYFPGGVSFWNPNEITPEMIGNINRSDGTAKYPRIKSFWSPKKLHQR